MASGIPASRPSWVSLLQSYESTHAIRGEIDMEHEVQRRLQQIFTERRVKAIAKEPSLAAIPHFYPPALSLRGGSGTRALIGGGVGQHQPQQQNHQTQQQATQQLQNQLRTQANDIMTGQVLLRNLARNRMLARKSDALFVEDDLHAIFEALAQHNSPPFWQEGDGLSEDNLREQDRTRFSGRINYDDFCAARDSLGAKLGFFFTADTFSKFRRDDIARISTQLFFQYICQHVAMCQTRVQLSWYDSHGDDYLREQDLENYIYELIPNLDALVDLQENFYPFYVFTAVRKFFFFLDPKKMGKVSITDLITSPILHELLHLQKFNNTNCSNNNHHNDNDNNSDIGNGGSSSNNNADNGEDIRNSDSSVNGEDGASSLNWFSAHNTLRVYSQYLELDIDHNGMLSRTEIRGYGTGSLTIALIDRVFEECLTYEGEMDYKTFLDFALAMETKKSTQSLAYFFRLLDINKCGYLDRFTINYFFREIVQRLQELDSGNNNDIVRVEDVTDEIFDMCKPRDPSKITLDDLIASNVGGTVVTILTDLSGFYAYDNREVLLLEEAREERE